MEGSEDDIEMGDEKVEDIEDDVIMGDEEGADEQYDEEENDEEEYEDGDDPDEEEAGDECDEEYDAEEDENEYENIDNDEKEYKDVDDEGEAADENDEDYDEENEVENNNIVDGGEKNDVVTHSEEDNTELIIIRSNKGGDKLCFNGRMYILHRKCTNFMRWRCTKHSLKSVQCKGAITTTLDKTDPVVVVDHNHIRDVEGINKEISMNRMKSKARDSFAKPSQIFGQEVQQLPNSTRARLPLEESVKRTLRNQRSREYPPEPTTVEELRIEGEYSTTGGTEKQRFLLVDNAQEEGMIGERVIVFATDTFLELLGEATAWYMDGNFELAPSQFLQLYVLRVSVDGIFITVAYALLERKTESTYTYLLQSIIDKCAELNVFPDPQTIHVDFEKAMINAVYRVLGDEVRIVGCFYHLTQSTYRKIQELKLTKLYKENEAFNQFCGMIDGLAFLPVKDVVDGMVYLQTIVPKEAQELLTYFDETYVRGASRRIGRPENDGRPTKIRRISPLFAIETWNVHDATMDSEGRTNNSTEGWNNRFKNVVGMSHPTVWRLIEKMREEVAVDTTKILQNDLGAKKNKKKRSDCEKREATLVKLCTEYADGRRSLKKFLKCVSHIIRFRRI